jgi:hypothetical protein
VRSTKRQSDFQPVGGKRHWRRRQPRPQESRDGVPASLLAHLEARKAPPRQPEPQLEKAVAEAVSEGLDCVAYAVAADTPQRPQPPDQARPKRDAWLQWDALRKALAAHQREVMRSVGIHTAAPQRPTGRTSHGPRPSRSHGSRRSTQRARSPSADEPPGESDSTRLNPPRRGASCWARTSRPFRAVVKPSDRHRRSEQRSGERCL